ncbi:MAG: alpha/beta fold hydrolase [Promethearchaeota archaeon]
MNIGYPLKNAVAKFPHKRLHYYHNDTDTSKPVLVFHHGFSDNGLCWDRLASKFVDDYQCYLLDARGHGKSSDPNGDLQYADLVQDVYDFCLELKLNDVTIIGHSMGGVVAAIAATNENLIRGAVLEDPAFPTNLMNKANLLARKVSAAMHLHRESPKPKEHYLKKMHRNRPNWDEQDVAGCVEASQQFELHYPLRDGRVLFSALKWEDIVSDIKKPVLLLTSTRGLLNRKDGINFQKRNSLVSWVHFEDKVGHSIRREAFDKYYTSVKTFLNKI